MSESSSSPDERRERGQSVTESILFRASLSVGMKKGGRGGGAGRGTIRRTSSKMDANDFAVYEPEKNDVEEDMAAFIDEIEADEDSGETMRAPLVPPKRASVKPPPPSSAPPPRTGMKPKPPPPPGAPKPKPPPPSTPPNRSSIGGGGGGSKPPPPTAAPPNASPSLSYRSLPPTPTSTPPPTKPTSTSSPQGRTQRSPTLAPMTFMPPPPPSSGNKAPVLPTSPFRDSSVSMRSTSASLTDDVSAVRSFNNRGSNNSTAFSMPVMKHEADYEVVIHSSMFKRGKIKWNQRYCVLIKPREGAGGLLFYFKNAKQFMKQASSGGSVSVDVARLFATPTPGKESPKELALTGCRVEPNADGWSTPTGTFGLMILDDKGVEYPFATDSNQMRNQWIAGLDAVINAEALEAEEKALTANVVVPLVKNNSMPGPMGANGLYSPTNGLSGRNVKDDSRRGQQTNNGFDVSTTGLLIELKKDGTFKKKEQGGGDQVVEEEEEERMKSVSLSVAVKLLSDRRFLLSRRSVELVMKELLTYLGDPAQIPDVLTRTLRNDGGEQVISAFLSRLIEFLSLEPIDSPVTSRIVGCALAILAAFVKGSVVSHRILATFPLLGELCFELNALISKSDHPGLLYQVAVLVSGIFSPSLVPVIADVVVCSQDSDVIKINNENDLEDLANNLPSAAPIEMKASDGQYLSFLKRDKSPLWRILFKLVSCPSEKTRVIALSTFSELSSFPEVAVAICRSHEHDAPTDRKSAGIMPSSPKLTHTRSGGNRKHVGSVDYDTFVEDVDEDEEEGGDTFASGPSLSSSIGLDAIYNPNQPVPDTNNVMNASANRGGAGRTIASVPRGRNGIASVPRGGLGQQGQQGGNLSRARSAVASVPRSGLSGLNRVAAHSASSPTLAVPSTLSFPSISMQQPIFRRRSPIVASLINLLSTENGDETRLLVLSCLRNFLTHSQSLDGYEPILRAVCTPDVMSASDLFSSISAKALRHLSEAVTINIQKQQSPVTRPHSASVFSAITALEFDEEENMKKPNQKLLSLKESAEVAIYQEIADASALCMWLISCLLTQHSAMASKGVKPSESFVTFSEKFQTEI